MTQRMSARSDRMLDVYLADHLAAATAGVALARRCARSNATNACGQTLRRLAAEIEEDRRTLRGIVAQLGFEESTAKGAVAWLGEEWGASSSTGTAVGIRPSLGFWNSRRYRSASPGNWRCGSRSSLYRASARASSDSIWRNLPSARDGSALPSRNTGCELLRKHLPPAQRRHCVVDSLVDGSSASPPRSPQPGPGGDHVSASPSRRT